MLSRDEIMSQTQKASLVLIVSVLAVAALVGLSFGYVTPDLNEKMIRFTEADIYFSGTDADIVIFYDTDSLVGSYVLLFGSHDLEDDVLSLVSPLGTPENIDFRRNQATVRISGISSEKNGFYLHDSCRLGETVEKLVLIYPDGREKVILNASETPDTFYEDETVLLSDSV